MARKARGARGRTFVKTVVDVEGRSEERVVEVPAFEPEPWGDEAALSIVGGRVPRMDAEEKVTGRARYTTDIVRPGMLHALILRAPIARGTLQSFDLVAARAVPGVVDVLGPGDAPPKARLFPTAISYAGQPVAAVCAESLEAAAAGARAMATRFDSAPFALTFEAATAPGASLVRSKGNVMEEIGRAHV